LGVDSAAFTAEKSDDRDGEHAGGEHRQESSGRG